MPWQSSGICRDRTPCFQGRSHAAACPGGRPRLALGAGFDQLAGQPPVRDLAVGALEETVTVSGQAPTVDVQSSTAQVQFEKATIEALPGAGRLTVLSDILPGATLTQEFNRGVGGTSDRTQTRYSVHGGPEAQPYVDGMNQQLPNSTQGVFVHTQLGIREVVV